MRPDLELVRPGIVEYGRALELQAGLARQVATSAGACAFLVLLEHPPVFTLGRNAGESHLLRRDPVVPVVRTDRGGDVTWHGPGQLVGYPILDLRTFRLSVRRYVCALERALLAVLAARGLHGARREGTAGVWVGERKIASIGVRVARGITTHGFALNVCNDLSPFTWIDPCGTPGMPMTSVARESGAPAEVAALGDEFATAFVRELATRCEAATLRP